MLILSRKVGEKIAIGDDVTIVINRIAGNRVAIGIEAPSHVRVVRGELERFADEFVDKRGSATAGNAVGPTLPIDNSTASTFVPRTAR
jgi:carbon storage regulator